MVKIIGNCKLMPEFFANLQFISILAAPRRVVCAIMAAEWLTLCSLEGEQQREHEHHHDAEDEL